MAGTLLILAAVAGGYAVVYFLLKKKIARTLATTNLLREVREELDRILVEMNQTTHRNVTLLEDRIAALGELLGKADRRIALARREAEKQELSERVYSELAARRQPPALEAATEQPAAPDPRSEAVRLGQAGLSPALIARRLGLPLGEVELILSLAEHGR